MPSKYYIRNFVPGYYYHIYNRGSRKQNIFSSKEDYKVFTEIITYYLKFPIGKPLSQTITEQATTDQVIKVPNLMKNSFVITAYCLLPNHFHFLFKQIDKGTNENNITNFMRRLSITYSMYYKKKYAHSGNIFEGKYKNVLVDNDNQLIYLTKYIHRNPLDLLNAKQSLSDYSYSSYPHYINKDTLDWLSTEEIISSFSQTKPNLTYKVFVEEKLEKQDFPEALKRLTFE